MPVIVVANPKGGVGKHAGHRSRVSRFPGHSNMLGDVDRQQSSRSIEAAARGAAVIRPGM
jgi:cellulose biosynthesis protein BcsQ